MGAFDIGLPDEQGEQGEPDEPADREPTDEARFREVLGHFASGVTVITTATPEGPRGFTCQAFAALSLTPALVAFAPSRSSATWAHISAANTFCVNVLNADQERLARVFATTGADRFAGVGWTAGVTGTPILADVLAWAECRLLHTHPAGDHLLVVGEAIELGTGARHAGPLVFYRGGFGRFEA
ncbi:MAG: flavin reductase family protein [Acidimicrobiales bacterium]